MGRLFAELSPEHVAFIEKQRMFFVASAPLSGEGHVNLSPKGYDVLRVLSSKEVAYMDLTGSGNETSAHVQENGRLTLMFMALEGTPLILRLYGRGSVYLPGTPDWERLRPLFPELPGARQIIAAKLTEIKTSCGFSVPYYSFAGDRDMQKSWAVRKGEDGLKAYRRENNTVSMDGLSTPLGLEGLE